MPREVKSACTGAAEPVTGRRPGSGQPQKSCAGKRDEKRAEERGARREQEREGGNLQFRSSVVYFANKFL